MPYIKSGLFLFLVKIFNRSFPVSYSTNDPPFVQMFILYSFRKDLLITYEKYDVAMPAFLLYAKACLFRMS